jgi:stage II sporulation protein D
LAIWFLLSTVTLRAQTIQSALSKALLGTPAAGVVVDVKTGQRLASVSVTSRPTTPGSILKPLFLAAALERQEVAPSTTVFCRRNLHITDGLRVWNLTCTHPQTSTALAAREALAYSCNRYFAELADRIPPEQIPSILEHYGLPPERPHTREQKQLLVLGLAGVTVSPEQMATAYQKLALQLADTKLEAVRDGLKDSVDYGMAHNASAPGMEIDGKTGTAADTPQSPSHGWFAGIGYLDRTEVALVIYLPQGNGADAATLAQHFFRAARPAPSESARDLTVELFSARTVKSLTAIGTDHSRLRIDWKGDGLSLTPQKTVKQLVLSGTYQLEDVAASGQWTISWRPEGIRVLLTLPSEDYVAAALNGEAAPDEPLASLKAMAISMRTFALEHANRHSAEGFGLCDSTHCQALRLQRPRPEVEQAVRETAGETLWFNNERAHIFYTQHCGGMSEAAIWLGEQASYLPGQRKDPYCLRRSAAEWQTRIPFTELSDIFREQGWQTPSRIANLRVARRTAAGRAQLLEVTGDGASAQISASSFHFAVDRALGWNQMRSDWYELKSSGKALEIRGRGYGHGVGLCQAGAYQMAVEGHSETDILRFYFPGTTTGITPRDRGWRDVGGAGWTLRTAGPTGKLIQEGNAAWTHAQSLFGAPADGQSPTVQEMPTTELFRQTTNQPGWMLGSTRGHIVFLQPDAVRQNNGGTETLLLHEFLHVLIEQQAGEAAPLWLREGLVETLAGQGEPNQPLDLSPAEVNAALAHPASDAASRHAHSVAARMTALLRARYGMPAVGQFLRNGVPSGVERSLGS